MRVLLTGASGFVGSALAASLVRSGKEIEKFSFLRMLNGEIIQIEREPDVCIHLAARVHMMNARSLAPLNEFRRCNTEGTITLARQAAAAGIKRFIFLSTVKVNGEATVVGHPFCASDSPSPEDPYALSKLEAEIALQEIATQTGMEVVIIRPPLIYGPGVKANFASMMRLIYRGVPLPIGGIRNKRSLIGIDNLISIIETCAAHSAAANKTFLVSDGVDLSTAELAIRIGAALGKPARLIPVPVMVQKGFAPLIRKSNTGKKLFSSLQVDISETREKLGWTPSVTVDEGLRRTAENWISKL